jgi:hypothetical protein
LQYKRTRHHLEEYRSPRRIDISREPVRNDRPGSTNLEMPTPLRIGAPIRQCQIHCVTRQLY